MKIIDTSLDGVQKIIQDPYFEDFRGYYRETYNKQEYESVFDIDFVQDDVSVSYKNVLKGIHGDDSTWKLISCLKGKFYLVVVNNNPKSAQYKEWGSFILSESNNIQIIVPPKFGNGHLVLEDNTIFHYKQSTYYGKHTQFTIKWDNPVLDIFWPINNPILSERDKFGPFFNL